MTGKVLARRISVDSVDERDSVDELCEVRIFVLFVALRASLPLQLLLMEAILLRGSREGICVEIVLMDEVEEGTAIAEPGIEAELHARVWWVVMTAGPIDQSSSLAR